MPLTGPELQSALDPAAAVERRSLLGGPARARVLDAASHAEREWSA
ncbi:MAG: hypothetical protein QM756_21955 [Polyangiaceae bacterium]